MDQAREGHIPRENSWSEQRLLESERQCADYTIRYIVVMLAHGVQKVFIHSGASGKVNEADYECALFGYGGAPQRLMPALAVLTSILGPSPRCVGERRSGEVWCAAFETGKNSVLVLWKPDDTGALEPVLPSGPALMWMDSMGRKLASPPRRLSTSPVYLVTRPGLAGTLMKAVSSGRSRAY